MLFTTRPTKDLAISSAAPTSNLNGAGLATGVAGGGTLRRTLLHFDLSSFPPDYYSVDSATIQIECNAGGFLDVEGAALRLTQPDWVEAEATWNNRKAGTPWAVAGGDYDAGTVVNDWYQPSLAGTVTIGLGLGADELRDLVADALVNRAGQLHLLLRQLDESAVLGTYAYTDREFEDLFGGDLPLLTVEYTERARLAPIMDDRDSIGATRPARAATPGAAARPASPRRT